MNLTNLSRLVSAAIMSATLSACDITSFGSSKSESTASATTSSAANVSAVDLTGTVDTAETAATPSSPPTIAPPALNRAPVFAAAGDHTAVADAGPQSVDNWASKIDDGDTSAEQSLYFVVTENTNPHMFDSQPSISYPSGTLRYNAKNHHGKSSRITVVLRDGGGTENGGSNTSAPVTFIIKSTTPAVVLSPNTPPSFTAGSDVSVLADSGAYSAPWASDYSDGDGGVQSLQVAVLSNDKPSLFTTQPHISYPSGTLRFVPNPAESGIATLTVVLTDDGAKTTGGPATSTVVTFVISIKPVMAETPTATTTPADGAKRVAVDSNVVATFSTNMLTSSLGTSDFTLKQGTSPVAADVAFDGTTATLNPAADLAPSTLYQATLTDNITDANGNKIDPTKWSFYTDGTGWGRAGLIETNNSGDASNPQVSVDSAGNAVAVWQQFDSNNVTSIWSNRYTASNNSWGSAELIETATGVATFPQVSVDSDGNAISVWTQPDDGFFGSIWSNRYCATVGTWGTAELIETGSGGAAFSQVSFDSAGNAVAIWSQSDDNFIYNIWSNRYTVGTGWSAAELVETAAGRAFYPQVSFDSDGNAIAVWSQQDSDNFSSISSILSNRYAVGTGWGTAELLENDNTGDALFPQVSFDSAGDAVAVWRQLDGSGISSIWSNRYTASTNSWGTGELIETNAGTATGIQMSVDKASNAVAVWQQTDNNSVISIWSNRYTAGIGWGTAELLETNDTGSAFLAHLSFDNAGNAIAVWYQEDGNGVRSTWSNRYSATTNSWGTAELIETDDAGDTRFSQLAVDDAGNAIAVWQQSDGTRINIVSNRFSIDAITP